MAKPRVKNEMNQVSAPSSVLLASIVGLSFSAAGGNLLPESSSSTGFDKQSEI